MVRSLWFHSVWVFSASPAGRRSLAGSEARRRGMHRGWPGPDGLPALSLRDGWTCPTPRGGGGPGRGGRGRPWSARGGHRLGVRAEQLGSRIRGVARVVVPDDAVAVIVRVEGAVVHPGG